MLVRTPWSDLADSELAQYRIMAWNKDWGGLQKLQCSSAYMTDIVRKDPAPDWDPLILCYYHATLICLYGPRRKTLKRAEIDSYKAVASLLVARLELRSDEWADFLRFAATLQIHGVQWNNTPDDQRSGQAMQNEIKRLNYFEEIEAFLDKCPLAKPYVDNLGAVTSRMNRREKFGELSRRFVIAYEGKHPDLEDERFDRDFDNYRQWTKTEKGQEEINYWVTKKNRRKR